MKFTAIFFCLVLQLAVLFSQTSDIKMHPAFFSPADSQKIFFPVEGSSFFKNNEYFNPLEEGYTLIGYYVQPSVTVQFTRDFRLSGGTGLLKYSGRDGFYKAEPFFRAQYQPSEWFQMILGNIYGGTNHKLIEPLYRWETDFTSPWESGLQFLFKTERLNADVWLNWEKFILQGDPFQEVLTVGISSEYFYTDQNSNFQISSPVQALFRHHGGQIDSVDLPLETLANWATGIKIRNTTGSKLFRYWEAALLYTGFSDFSPQKLQQFKNGFGIFPSLSAKLGSFYIETGYFYGNRYISSQGEKLFHSGTAPGQTGTNEIKQLVTGKIFYRKQIGENIQLSAYFESYSGLINSQTDYDYGVHILFSPSFFLGKYR